MASAQRRVAFVNAIVISMNPQTEILDRGDVVIEGSEIVAVTPSSPTPPEADEIIDVGGSIIMPGFVDTHRHCWQTPLRRLIPDVNDMAGYLNATHRSIALKYRPEDMYVGSYLAGLSAIDSGITSLVDFSHNSRTAAHVDQALAGLIDSGVRGSFAYGPALAGVWDHQWPGDLGRVVEYVQAHGEGRTSVRLAMQGSAGFAGPETAMSEQLLALARAHGVGVSVDGIIGSESSGLVENLGSAGVLGPDVTLIHCQAISEQAWDAIAASGAGVSLTVTSDAQIGIGDAFAPVDRARVRGIVPSLSIDVETVLPGDMFTQMRALLSLQRMMFVRGETTADSRVGVADVLEYATRGGATVNGQASIVGSLTPGRKADLIVVRTDGVATFPSNDPIGTVVSGVDSSAIDTVLIDGVFRKRNGRLVDVDLDGIRERAAASRDYLLAP